MTRRHRPRVLQGRWLRRRRWPIAMGTISSVGFVWRMSWKGMSSLRLPGDESGLLLKSHLLSRARQEVEQQTLPLPLLQTLELEPQVGCCHWRGDGGSRGSSQPWRSCLQGRQEGAFSPGGQTLGLSRAKPSYLLGHSSPVDGHQ